MKIIPVIDYKQGQVVLAKYGKRDEYQPVDSLLCDSSDIYNVIDAILTLADFKTIYIADLDCIEKQQLNSCLWTMLCQKYPTTEFWIDLGSLCNEWPKFMANICNARPVLGSESFETTKELNTSLKQLNAYNPLISIDIKMGEILGPESLLQSNELWPKDVIILAISRVGSDKGPDNKTISNLQAIMSNKNIYYGGGIRNTSDIQQLRNAHIQGVLLASILHNGKLTQQEINNITS